MKISDILPPGAVVSTLRATDKTEALKELARALAGTVNGTEENAIFRALNEREKLGSTGIGRGVAIPHARLEGLTGIHAAFGRSLHGIYFGSPDGRPAHLIFLLLAPSKEMTEYLAVLDRVSKLMWNENNRRRLIEAPEQTLFLTLQQIDEEV